MRRFMALITRELVAYFNSPIAYVSLTAFLFIAGLSFYLNMLGYDARGLPATYYDTMHVVSFLVLLVAPLITMRLISEEKNQGTIETLMTAPVRDHEVVMAKFLASLAFFVFLVAPTLVLVAVLARFGSADKGAILTAYLGTILMVMGVGAIGLFVSSLCSNQMVAGFVTLVVVLALSFLQLATYAIRDDAAVWRQVAQQVNLIENALPFMQGILDSRPVIYFVSLTVLFLAATVWVVGARRWIDRRRSVPVFLLTLLLLVANLVVLNRISYRNFVRVDMTATKKFEIDPRTVSLLRNLKQDLHIYGNPLERLGSMAKNESLPPAWQRFRDLIGEYQKYAGDRLHYKEINPNDTEEQKFILESFKEFEPHAIYVWTGEGANLQKARVRIWDLYDGDPETGKIHSFHADSMLYGAITKMLRREKSRIFVSTGHQELNPLDRSDYGLSILTQRLALDQNAEMLPLNLIVLDEIPSDCELILILAPRVKFRPEEVRRLDRWLERGRGNLFVALLSGQESGLEPLLKRWGFDIDPSPVDNPAMRGGIIPVEALTQHPINQGASGFLFPTPCIVRSNFDPKKRPELYVQPLFYSGPGSRAWRALETPSGIQRRPIEPEHQVGFPIAAACERTFEDGAKGRIVVWGSGQALWNTWVHREQVLAPYFVNTVKWLKSKEEEITKIPQVEEAPLKLTEGQRTALMVIALIALPLLGVMLGGVAWFFRRK